MNVSSTNRFAPPTGGAQRDPRPPQAPEPEDRFLSDDQAEALKIGLGASLIGSAVLGVPAVLGAVAGGWGVAASALGYGALASQAEDTSEYPTSHNGEIVGTAVFGGCVAAVGAAAGLTGAATCAALGASVGGLILLAAWIR